MDEIFLLWFLSIFMLICSFLAGLVPLAFRLSDTKSRLLALLGSGILVGTALSIIIPEGVDSLYGPLLTPDSSPVVSKSNLEVKYTGDQHSVDSSVKTVSTSTKSADIIADQILSEGQNKSLTWLVGVSLIVGFVLMLLIEQFSIYQGGGGGHHHQGTEIIHASSIRSDYTLTSQDDDIDIGLEEEDEKPIVDVNISDSTTMRDTHKITMKTATVDGVSNSGISSNPNRYYDHSRHIINHKAKNARVTPTLGLVIHAAADGIALGAAASTSHRNVEMIIFLAIMLHKAPAAFSLVVLLLHNGLRPSSIRRHLLAFSLSAPIAAIVTFYGLSQSGKEALRRNNATGIAMLFSAGTFLFVATVHVLPELIQNKLLTPREMFCLLGGAFLPLLLTQMI